MTRGDAATGSQLAGGPKAGPRSRVVELSDAVATDPSLTGGKAAALARAQVAGLRTLGGVVLTTMFCREIDDGTPLAGHPSVREAFVRAGGEDLDLVVRSSSVVE